MEQPDGILVTTSRGGNPEAYAQLVNRHLKRVFAICLGFLGDLTEAEDVAQEAFVRGYERIHGLRDADRYSSWIDQIARNLCRDNLRKKNRRHEHPLTLAVENSAAAPHDPYSDLRHALSRLPEEHRLPLMLYYFDGKDTSTLAREMGLSQGGACTRLFRARNQLRKLLEEEVPHHGK